MKDKKISAFELFQLLPDEELDALSHSTGVNFQVRKLHGKTVLLTGHGSPPLFAKLGTLDGLCIT